MTKEAILVQKGWAMQVTAKTEYALRAMMELAARDGEPTTAADIASRQRIPENILPGIIRSLATAGLVETSRGFGGGVRLAPRADAITVREIWEAMEGELELARCGGAGANCPVGLGEPCPLRKLWERTKARMLEEWGNTTLRDLARPRGARRSQQRTRGRLRATAATT